MFFDEDINPKGSLTFSSFPFFFLIGDYMHLVGLLTRGQGIILARAYWPFSSFL